jgi:F420-0:gamma-glutamyl ligase-like protein
LTGGYNTITVKTGYWRPGHDYLKSISSAIASKLRDRDVVVLSEKALSVAEGRIVDETKIAPSLTARIIARFWMRLVWGYLLVPICHLSRITAVRLRSYPVKEGAAHKQLSLVYAGFLQALRHGSEGGIDVTNVPYSYAALPLRQPQRVAERIVQVLREASSRDIAVMIVDSDKTYTWRSIHVSPRKATVKGILSLSLPAYVLGRALRLRARSTPIALAGRSMATEEALRIAALANRARGSGAGRTAWDMAERLGVGLTEVTWESLGNIRHKPIVIVRNRLK